MSSVAVGTCIAVRVTLPVDIGMTSNGTTEIHGTRAALEDIMTGELYSKILAGECRERFILVVENPDGTVPFAIKVVIDEDPPVGIRRD